MTPVKLTTAGGEPLYADAGHIAFFKKHPCGKGSVVCIEYGPQAFFEHTRETPAQLLRLLDAGKPARREKKRKSLQK